MSASTAGPHREADGSVVLRLCGAAEDAVELRQLLVRVIGRVRPLRLILDLAAVAQLDPINCGSLRAACLLGDDHQVAVFIDNASADVGRQLTEAGIPPYRIRHTAAH